MVVVMMSMIGQGEAWLQFPFPHPPFLSRHTYMIKQAVAIDSLFYHG